MAESQAALAKRDDKRRLKKEVSNAIYLNLSKEAIEVQRLDVEAKKAYAEAKMRDAEGRRMDAEAKIWAEDTRIMLADLGGMDDETSAWFLKKRAEIRTRDAGSASPLSSTMAFFWTISAVLAMFVSPLDYILCHIMCTM